MESSDRPPDVAARQQAVSVELQTRRLRESVKYVARAWMPVNQMTLKHTLSLLARPDVLREDILSEIKSDLALYGHMLRSVGIIAAETGKRNLSPHELFLSLTKEQCSAMFSLSPADLSVHDLASIRAVQLNQVRRTLISCSTAELLASRGICDPELAFGCSMARQLGSLLVAWNYQSSVVRAKQAFEAAGEEGSFDEELNKLLGFSPESLGFELASTWSQSPAFLQGVGLKTLAEDFISSPDDLMQGKEILKICKLGEGLARANDPEYYPRAVNEWGAAHGKELERILGPKGPELVRQRIEELFPHYVTLAPQLFNRDLSPERVAKQVNLDYCRKLLAENNYVAKCKPELRKAFTSVYEKVLQQEASMSAVSELIAKIIPMSGFIHGCVYFLDPNKMVLVPRLKIGINNNKPYRTVSCSCGGERSHPVSEAFHCSFPFKEENVILNGDVISHITGKFGAADKIGILHLEFVDEPPNEIPSDQRLIYFKAIRQALGDSLGLR